MRVFCINPMELANAKGTTITGLARLDCQLAT